MNKKDNKIPTWVIVIIVIIVIVVFIASLGTLNAGTVGKFPEEFKDSKEEAKRKHKRLTDLIEKQVGLKAKLEKRFRRTYFFVRLSFILLWGAAIAGLYVLGLIKGIGDILNYSEASILLLIALNFLVFGRITNLENYVDLIKTRTENWVYGKYIKIDDNIEINKNELEKIVKEIAQ